MTEDLLIKYMTGKVSDEQIKIIEDWLSLSEQNRKDLARLKNCWILSGLTGETDVIMKNLEIQKILKKINIQRRQSQKIRRLKFIKYAAAIILFISLSVSLKIYLSAPGMNQNDQLAEIIVSPGERSQLILPDGSKVKLNGDSRLKFPVHFNEKNRTVYLKGEAFFDVKHQPDKPFIVNTSSISIEVLGTKFNVSGYANDAYVLTYLETGKIKITDADQKGKKWILSPAEAFRIDKASGDFSKTNITDNRYLDWTRGILTIKGETIEELTKKLERRFNVVIKFRDEEVKSHTYSGSIKDEELTTVLEALKFTSSLNYTIYGDTVTLQSK